MIDKNGKLREDIDEQTLGLLRKVLPHQLPFVEECFAANSPSFTFGTAQKYDKMCEKGASQFTEEKTLTINYIFLFNNYVVPSFSVRVCYQQG